MRDDTVLPAARLWQMVVRAAPIMLLFVALALLLFLASMHKGLSHDEHMYVGAGLLMGSQGLWPYRDFAYFQMPYLALLYAPLAWVASEALLWARALNTLSALGSAAVIMWAAFRFGEGRSYLFKLAIGTSGVVFFVCTSPFVYASGLAWNHDLPVFLTLLSTAMVCEAITRRPSPLLMAGSGALLGVAIGTRLSFAPVLIPLLVAALLFGRAGSRLGEEGRPRFSLQPFLACVGGVVASLLPALALLLVVPSNFIFDNLGYHSLNERYWQQAGYTRAMALPGKLDYLWQTVIGEVANWLPLLTLAILAAGVAAGLLRRAGRAQSGVALCLFYVLAVSMVLIAGALAPSPTWLQYFYAPAAPLALCLAVGAAGVGVQLPRRGAAALALGLVAVAAVCVVSAVPKYAGLGLDVAADTWVPVQVGHTAQGVSRALEVGAKKGGPVATLAPLFALEGGLPIYPELAAGPFGIRVASFLPAEQRAIYRVPSTDDIARLIRGVPPVAVLTGPEPQFEDDLTHYARDHVYRPMQLQNGATLWVAP